MKGIIKAVMCSILNISGLVGVFTPPGENQHGHHGRNGIDNLVIDVTDFQCAEQVNREKRRSDILG